MVVALGLWSTALGVAVFSPTSDRPNRIVDAWDHLLLNLGAPNHLASFGLWEVLFNVAMFLPVGALAPFVFAARGRRRWLVIGIACGCFVEATQALLLPQRDPSWSDVLANGAGVFLGYVLLEVGGRLRWWRFPGGIVSIADWTRGEPMLRKFAIALALPFLALVFVPFLVQLTLGGPGPTPDRVGEVPGISPVKVPHPLHPTAPK